MNAEKYPFWLILFSAVLFYSCDAESITQPGKNGNGIGSSSVTLIGGSNDDLGQKIILTSDNGLLVVGTSSSNDGTFSGLGIGNRDIFALKMNSSGNIEWVNTFGGSSSDRAKDVIEDSAGNYIITGYSGSNNGDFSGFNRGGNDIFLIKISPNGQLIWTRTYGGSDDDFGYALAEGPNGGYVVTGSTRSTDGNFSGRSNSSLDIFTMLTSVDGVPAWIETFGGSGNDEGLGISISNNNTIAVTGSFQSNNGTFSGIQIGQASFFILELRLSGNPLGITSYGGSGIDIGNTIISTQDGGFAIAGITNSDDVHFNGLNRGDFDAFVMKTDAGRNIQWVNTFGGSNFDEATDIVQSPTGEFIISGSTRSNNQNIDGLNRGELDAFLMRVNLNGEFNSAITYGGSESEITNSVVRLSNGNFALAGLTESTDGDFEGSTSESENAFIIFTDSSGEILE